ncbi:MAG: FtsQ-type POTRA domain-containing protein [Candidatus Cloacimonadales bacterium]
MRKKRGSSRYYILFICIIFSLVAVGSGLKYLIKNLNILQIQSVTISGNRNLETEFLTNISQDFLGKNLYEISKTDVLKKYSNINRIKDISISRKLPNKLEITIEEKKGYMYLCSKEGELFPLTKDYEILDNTQYFHNEILPVISSDIPQNELIIGEKISSAWLQEVYSIAEVLSECNLFDDISEFYRSSGEIVLVQSPIGFRIVLGQGDLKEKLERYKLLRDNRSFAKDSYIDLRFENKLIERPGV